MATAFLSAGYFFESYFPNKLNFLESHAVEIGGAFIAILLFNWWFRRGVKFHNTVLKVCEISNSSGTLSLFNRKDVKD